MTGPRLPVPTHEWIEPQLVLHMLRILGLALWFAPAVFMAGPLTADDLYGAPDPGWYNQGSGWSREPGYGGSGYDSGYAADDYGTGAPSWRAGPDDSSRGGYRQGDRSSTYDRPAPEYGYDDYGREAAGYRERDGIREPWRRDDAPEPVSPDGYGAPDWAQEPLSPRREPWEASYRRGYDDAGRSGDGWRPPPDGLSHRGDPWRAPPARPRYRFRDDPSLERGITGSTPGGFRFRPLTDKEQERHRSFRDDDGLADTYRDRRYRPRDDSGRGTAFGYAPDSPPSDDFYRRYYRSGP